MTDNLGYHITHVGLTLLAEREQPLPLRIGQQDASGNRKTTFFLHTSIIGVALMVRKRQAAGMISDTLPAL